MTSRRRPPPTRADFGAWSQATTRWADIDGFAHMNNARYFELIDTAIDLAVPATSGAEVADPAGLGVIGVVAEVSCRFFREVRYPDPIDLGVAVERVGRSSVSYRVGLFQGQGDEASAEGSCVQVYVDSRDPARPVVPVPDAVRAAVERLLR